MNRSQNIISLFLEEYSYASLQLSLSSYESASTVERMNALIPRNKLFLEEEKDRGEPHVTVFYGFQDEDYAQVQRCLTEYGPLTYTILGQPQMFTNPRYNVFYLPIESLDLVKVHAYLRRCTGKEPPTFREYKPHATFAYVLPTYRTLPEAVFDNVEGTVTSLDFHRKSGQPQKVHL